MYPNTSVYGGVGYPVLCWGTGYLDASGDIQPGVAGGGVRLKYAKISDNGEIVWEADPVTYVDGSIRAFPLGWRPAWGLAFDIYRVIEDSYLSDPKSQTNLRIIINYWLATSCVLTFYPTGNSQLGYKVYVENVEFNYLNSVLVGHQVSLDLIATQLYPIDTTIVPDPVNPLTGYRLGYFTEVGTSNLYTWGTCVCHERAEAALDCIIQIRDDTTGNVRYYDKHGRYNPLTTGNAYNILTDGYNAPFGTNNASSYYIPGAWTSVMNMVDGVFFLGADAQDFTWLIRTKTSSDVTIQAQGFGALGAFQQVIYNSLLRTSYWRSAAWAGRDTAPILMPQTWSDICVRMDFSAGALMIDVHELGAGSWNYSFVIGSTAFDFPAAGSRKYIIGCNANPAVRPIIEKIGLAHKCLTDIEIDNIRAFWGT